ncbi:MFS transporter [Rhodococcoides corynebacterioides]|uniref:MHS family MFS transporter n=1 Tax=Rhodococcoides corynebacterioides TaxID=53972 RepID=A0ABS7NYF1_9NOCA|nr:MFS transporter [Rhodococcus corynebacterioides]MBY6365173.1 MHS family MFS transporter [Rhodococcus corynebacterioides]MBY6406585.1 MHS family MFS transporter [Rhodococcus corynebacterioides]
MSTLGPDRSPSYVRRVALSSYLGTTIEYYDFLLYGTAAALVFNRVFFSNLSPVVGTLVALATLAAGYVARFVGAIVFGHFGDRFGRKNVMVVTMVTMGITSGAIGLLPTYDRIGAAAPLLLVMLRLVQGFAVGGEYGGAVLMVSEHASTEKRGLASSSAAMGAPTGSVLATGAMLWVASLPEDQMLSWGWRVPFLCSFGLLALGMYFRARISESPVFEDNRSATKAPAQGTPILALTRSEPATLLKSILFQIGPYCGMGVFAIFFLSYTPTIGHSRSAALTAVLLGTLSSIVMTPVYAALSDKIGRRPVIIAGITATAVLAFPIFHLVNTGSTATMVITVSLYIGFVMTSVNGVAPVMLTELFPTEVRYTAVSTSYQLAQTIGSGFSPLIATTLLAAAGGGTNTWPIALFLVVISVASAWAALSLPERSGRDLDAVRAPRPAATSNRTVATAVDHSFG